jgi:uncharacterized protein YqiB (DUF1249 family)
MYRILESSDPLTGISSPRAQVRNGVDAEITEINTPQSKAALNRVMALYPLPPDNL